jgi:hypothetical protein
MVAKMLFSVLLLQVHVLHAFTFPKGFEGLWMGTPLFNMLGEWDKGSYIFSISRAPNGDYLMENNLIYDDWQITGYQRFYVEGYGDTSGTLWYCGSLSNFSNVEEQTGSGRLNRFFPLMISESVVTFCLDSKSENVMGPTNPFKFGCSECSCSNWTLAYNDSSDVLISQLSMSGSEGHTNSKHLWIELRRIGQAPEITNDQVPDHGADFSCDFSEGGRDSNPINRSKSILFPDAENVIPSGCPFFRVVKMADKRTVEDTELMTPRS